MALKLIIAASSLAVSLVEAKSHVKKEVADDDALVTAMITAATEMAEQYTGRAIMPQTYALTLDAFPTALELTRTPVASVTSVTYTDTAGAVQTLSSSLYTLDSADDNGPSYVVPAYGETWPDTREQINAVTCTFVAGYANAAAVPEGIKQYIKLMIGTMDANRESQSDRQAYQHSFVDRLLDRYKVWAL